MKKNAFLPFLLILTVLLSFSASAYSGTDTATVRVSASSGYYMVDTFSYKPTDGDGAFVFPEPDNGGVWSCSGMFSDAYTRKSYDTVFYTAAVRQDTSPSLSGGMTFTFDLRDKIVDAGEYSFLRFGIGVLSGDDKGYFVKIRADSDVSSAAAYSTVYSNSSSSALSVVTVDLSAFHGTLATVRITVYFDIADRPEQVKISSPFLSKDKTYFINSAKYLFSEFEEQNGAFDPSDGAVTPDANGNAVISADYSGEYMKVYGKVYCRVSMSGVQSGGIGLTLDYCDSRTGKRMSVESPRVELYQGEEEYVFPLEFYGSVTGYSLELSGLSPAEKAVFDSLSLETVREDEKIGGIGDVTKITLDGDSIRFSGTVQREAAKQYSDSEIAFFAVPGNLIDGDSTELGRIRITTKFEHTLSLADNRFSPDLCMYMAAIVTPDGEIIPIEKPRYADARPAVYSESSILGLYGMATVGAFESNCSHVIVDVQLDKIISAERSPVSTAYQISPTGGDEGNETRTLYFDRTVLDSLDEEINFCLSAGIRVYLRFVSASPVEGLTYSSLPSDNYALCFTDEESAYAYAAVVRFLAGRYNGLDGFAVCTDAALSVENGIDLTENAVHYTEKLAEIARITYNSALSAIENPVIIVPVSDGGDVSLSRFTTVFADHLSDIGGIPWTLMYNTDSLDEDTEYIDALGERLSSLGVCGFDSLMTFFESEEFFRDGKSAGEYADIIGAFCENAVNMQAVVISLDGTTLVNDREFYSELKEVNGVGYVLSEEAESGERTNTGSYTLCDFYDKYYSLGWRAVGADSFRTDVSLTEQSPSRALRADFSNPDGTASGIMLKNFERTTDMTAADGITFSLSMNSAEPENAAVVFVIGTDELRAEYSTEASTDGTVRSYYCDLGKYRYRDRADYVGIIVYADSPVSLELGSVKLTSDTLSSEELADRMNPKPETGKDSKDVTAVALVSTLALLLTAVVFILILTKEKEIKDTKGRDEDESEQ